LLVWKTVHVVLVVFVYLVYVASPKLGSPKDVYAKLAEVASKSRDCTSPINHPTQACGPVSGNNGGSYLTMMSTGGLVFGIINIVGNFGTVFVDNVSFSLNPARAWEPFFLVSFSSFFFHCLGCLAQF
jgi:Na+/proline symporter